MTETYTISATFCRPGHEKPDPKGKITALLTKGYSIFYYDRLGVEKSEQGLGYVAQLSNQVAILTELAKLVKGGHYVGGTGRPSKTVLVGHGFGSAISSEVVRKNRKLVDGVVLTGFSYNSTHLNGLEFLEAADVQIAAHQKPGKSRQLDTAFKAISLPRTGHGINFHTTAAKSFEKITSFLASSGL
ncbi:hypothetical protein QC764_0048010 [Podospora pseudoanserina]|uniref:Serine aminopeptidase S33 domain-containing protein n=1 Tax=Podospora pseudoanserina TaxID=2609844 RepID=A0ABR0IC78_9PEZI|nr:hypothetical protein QC764_0048010 [Podospora pseudoanserina]